jgi:DNA-binding Lrp family transcriptional regulator
MTDICSNDNMEINMESNMINDIQNHIDCNNITVSDSDDTFVLEHYKECDENSDVIVKECRGIIKLKSTGEVICKTFPFTPEILFGSDKMQSSVESMCENGAKFYPSYEGTVLRVWCQEDKWYISTHRKLDANKSRWGSNLTFQKRFVNALLQLNTSSENFANYFKECTEDNIFEKYTSYLDKDYIYTYLIRTSNDTRIVCSYENEDLFYVGAFKKGSFDFIFPEVFNVVVPIIPNINIDSFADFITRIKDNAAEVCNNWRTQGIIAIDKKGNSVKYMNPEYVKWYKVRGNEPILVQAYINKVKSGNVQDINNFMFLYQHNQEFREYELIMHDVKRNILNNYIRRYIHKKIVAAPPEQHKVLVHLYNLYLKNRQSNVLNHQWIDEQVNRLPTVEIYNLYKQYKYRREHFGNGNALNEDVIKRTNSAYYKQTEEKMN